MGLELFRVLNESLHNVEVLVLPNLGERLVHHQQIELLKLELVDEVLLRYHNRDSFLLPAKMELQVLILPSVLKVLVNSNRFLNRHRP